MAASGIHKVVEIFCNRKRKGREPGVQGTGSGKFISLSPPTPASPTRKEILKRLQAGYRVGMLMKGAVRSRSAFVSFYDWILSDHELACRVPKPPGLV